MFIIIGVRRRRRRRLHHVVLRGQRERTADTRVARRAGPLRNGIFIASSYAAALHRVIGGKNTTRVFIHTVHKLRLTVQIAQIQSGESSGSIAGK